MISRSDLILLNINMSKKSIFYVIFSAKKFVLSMIVCIFAASVLAKPLNNAQIVRGVFCLYPFEYGESYSGQSENSVVSNKPMHTVLLI